MTWLRLHKKAMIFSTLAMSLVSCVALLVYAAYDKDFGPNYIHYNGFIFETYVSGTTGDMEGALAVGGHATMGPQFDIGAAYTSSQTQTRPNSPKVGMYKNPNKYPTLLLNALPTLRGSSSDGSLKVVGSGSLIVMPESAETPYNNYLAGRKFSEGTIQYADDDRLQQYFTDARNDLTFTSHAWSAASPAPPLHISDIEKNPSTWGDLDRFLVTQVNGQAVPNGLKVISINFTKNESDGISTEINKFQTTDAMGKYDVVILNFPDTHSAKLNEFTVYHNGNKLYVPGDYGRYNFLDYATFEKYCSTLVWNFPRAEDITMSRHTLVGSMIAPEADVVAHGGSLNGMLVAESFETKDKMELHAFRMRDIVIKGNRTGAVQLLKRDTSDTSRYLNGAVFDLQQLQDDGTWTNIETGLTTGRVDGQDGYLRVEGLPIGGTYRFVETQAPAGYDISEVYQDIDASDYPLRFTLRDQDQAVYLTALNPPTGSTEIKLWKYGRVQDPTDPDKLIPERDDHGNIVYLKNAVFNIYRVQLKGDGSGKPDKFYLLGQVSSKDGGLIRQADVPDGIYAAVETSAPSGYHANSNNYTVLLICVENGTVDIRNISDYAQLNDELNTNNITELDLNDLLSSAPSLEDVEPGMPGIPNDKNEPHDPDDPDSPDPDDPNIYTLEAVKKDADTMEVLGGAEFTLYIWNGGDQSDIGNYIVYPSDSPLNRAVQTTGPLGRVKWSGLKEGVYRIHESGAPPGYSLWGDDDDWSEPLKLPADDTTGSSTRPSLGYSGRANEADTAKSAGSSLRDLVTFRKSRNIREDLPDQDPPAEIRPDEKPADAASEPEGEAGQISLGYSLRDAKKEIINETFISYEFHNEKELRGGVWLIKIEGDKKINTSLVGAVFDLYKRNHNREWDLIEANLTTVSGGVYRDNLTIGTYKLVEKKAPDGYVIDEYAPANEYVFSLTRELLKNPPATPGNVPEAYTPKSGIIFLGRLFISNDPVDPVDPDEDPQDETEDPPYIVIPPPTTPSGGSGGGGGGSGGRPDSGTSTSSDPAREEDPISPFGPGDDPLATLIDTENPATGGRNATFGLAAFLMASGLLLRRRRR